MLDFRRASPPRYFATRPERLAVLFVVVVLGLLLGLSRDWRQLKWLLQPPPDTMQQGGRPSKDFAVDTRVSPRSLEEEPGTFRSPATSAETPPEPPASRYFRGVMPNYLEAIRDDSPFSHAEKDAWFNLLDVLNKTELESLKRASKGPVTFVQLYRQSDEYRGELVSVRGTLRRVYPVTAPKNDYGIKSYYQIWLTPDDNPSSVEVVYCLRLPPNCPTGENLAETVELTGFYFKRWLYHAQDALRTAPVILAPTVEWQKRPVLAKKPVESPGMLLAIFAGTALCAVLLVGVLHFRTRRVRNQPAEKTIEIPDVHEPHA